ncbi:hypothetical protein [Companilactobacillus halodurans]|uniref:Uncharacterized protein n=1 Tax=Companilactobacillus halodurans TaxID=2584183 RepID=A0A5P0ZRY7_9LACO|nr:hypothetical protein [Companilactobacillus halodurans]MQS76962.1 hypothetical protein [Companilactobacillus halodurans]MQS96625.1 hypothetical protein [Companilactobacillus halodurans]
MQTLDQSKSYYRRITVLDVMTLVMIIGFLFFAKGYLLSLLLIVIYPFCHSKVMVSSVLDKNTRLWVRNMDWNYYRKIHGIKFFMQYKPQESAIPIKHVN